MSIEVVDFDMQPKEMRNLGLQYVPILSLIEET